MVTNIKTKNVFERYPKTEHRSLQAWNAADEYILEHFETLNLKRPSIAIYNDRFGFLTCNLHEHSPDVCINYASQKKAICLNLNANQISKETIEFVFPLTVDLRKTDIAIVKIPKSMDLFRLQLINIARSLDNRGIVLCGFMTKYFTSQMLSIAGEFFESVEQSKARKKSRILILQGRKPQKDENIVNSISFEDQTFKQYFGVFSAGNIDYASQFFIRNWQVNDDVRKVFDLASGNGFLAKMIRLQNSASEIHLMDDDWLALESSKMNFDEKDENTFFHFNDSLENFEDDCFDLVVCNPPFHFEFETNIEVAIGLFQQVKRCLSEKGSFQIVANRHLNYKTHLSRMFDKVSAIRKNKKFEILNCQFSSND